MTLELRGVANEVGGQVWIHPADLTLARGPAVPYLTATPDPEPRR